MLAMKPGPTGCVLPGYAVWNVLVVTVTALYTHHCGWQQLNEESIEASKEVQIAAVNEQAQVVLHCSLQALQAEDTQA